VSVVFYNRQGLRHQGDVLSNAAFQCRAGSYRTTSKPTNNRHNLQHKETQLLAYADDIDFVGRSHLAVRDGYLAFDKRISQSRVKNK
jgi:hypothetical protein